MNYFSSLFYWHFWYPPTYSAVENREVLRCCSFHLASKPYCKNCTVWINFGLRKATEICFICSKWYFPLQSEIYSNWHKATGRFFQIQRCPKCLVKLGINTNPLQKRVRGREISKELVWGEIQNEQPGGHRKVSPSACKLLLHCGWLFWDSDRWLSRQQQGELTPRHQPLLLNTAVVGQGNCVRYHLGSGWHWRKWTWFMAGLQDLAGPWIPQLTADLLLVNVINWYIYYPNTADLSPLNVISAGFCLGLSHPVIARLPLQKVGRLPAGFAWSPYIFLSIWTGCWLCLGAYNTPSGLCSEKSFATTNIYPFKIDFQ